MDLDEFLANPLASVAKRQRRREPIAEEMDPSLMRRLTDAGMSGLAMVGNVLDLPGSFVRDTLAGENPFDQLAPWNWTSGENRVSGKELLQRYRLISDEPSWGGTIAGFAADIALDPTTYLTGGASALSKAGKIGKMAGILDDITSIRPMGMRQGRLSTTLGDLVANNPAAREALERTAAAAGETLTPELMGQQLGGLWKAHGPLAFLNNEAGVIGSAGGKAEAFARTLDNTARAISESAPGRMVSSLFEHAVRGQYGKSAQQLARLVTKNQQKYGPMGRAGALDIGDQVNPVLDELAGTPGVADEIMAARRRELVQPYEEQLANAAESVKLRGNYDQRVKEFVDAKQAELDAATGYSPASAASAAPAAATTHLDDYRKIANTDDNYKAWSNLGDGSDRTAFEAQINAPAEAIQKMIDAGKVKASDATPDAIADMLKQYKAFANNQIRKDAAEALSKHFQNPPTSSTPISPPTSTTAPAATKPGAAPAVQHMTRYRNIANTDDNYKAWSNLGDGSDRPAFEAQINAPAEAIQKMIDAGKVKASDATPDAIADMLKQYKAFANNQIRKDAAEALSKHFQNPPTSSTPISPPTSTTSSAATKPGAAPAVQHMSRYRNIANTDDNYKAWSNIGDGSDRAAFEAQINAPHISIQKMIDAGKIKPADLTPDAIADMLKQYKAFANNQIRKDAAEALSKYFQSPSVWSVQAPTAAAKTLNERVFDAYFELTKGASNHRVRLSDLRDKVGGTPEELTKELMDLERAGKIALYPLDHPLEISPKDVSAAINNSAGSPRHVVYIDAKDRPTPPQQPAASAAPTATPSGTAKRQTYKLTKEDDAAIVRDIKNIRANLDEATKRVSIANSVFDSLDKATEVRRVLNDIIRHTGEKDIEDAMKVFGLWDYKKKAGKLPANAQQSIGSAVDAIRTFNKELVDEINRLGGGVRLLGEDDTGEVLSYMTRYVDVSRLSRSDRQAIAEALNLEAKRLGVEVSRLPPNVVKQVTEEMSPARSWQAGSTKTAVDMARSHETRHVPAKIVNDLLTDPNLRVEPGDPAGLVAAAEYILDNYVDYLDTAYTGRSKHQIAYDLAKWAEKNKGQPGFPGMMEKRAKLFSTPDAKNSLEQHALELAQWVRLHPRRKMYTHDVMTDAMRYAEAGHRKVGMLKAIHEYLRQSAKGFLGDNLAAEAKRLGVNVQDLAPDVVERVASETRRSTVPLARVYEEAGMDVESSLKYFANDGNLTPEQLNRLTVDPEVAQAVAAVIRSDPQTPWGKAIGKFIDDVNGFMRANLTLPFPSFHVRNLSSGLYVNFATGAINSPEDMKRYMDAVQVARAMAKDTNNPQYRSYLRELEVYRVHGAQSGERMATGSEDVPLNPFIPLPDSLKQNRVVSSIDTGYQNVMQLGSKAMQTVEYYNRVPLYIYYRRKGYEPAAAALEVKKRHFDYTELAPAERELFKRGFLFYSFTRKMAPLVVQTLMERPGGVMAQSIKTAAKLHDDQDTPIPNWIRETTAIPLGGTADGTKRFITGLGLPQEDVFSFLPSPMQELLSRTTPPIKAAAELSFGRSLFQRGRPLEDLDPNLGRTLANIRQLAGGPKADVRAKPLFGSQGLEFLAANSPLSRAISSARTLTDPRKSWTDAGINFLTGARITDVSAGAQEAELQEAANRLIKRLGGRTFQTTYIPTEEQATMTPAELQEFAGLQMLQRQIAARARERRKRRLAAEGTNTTP